MPAPIEGIRDAWTEWGKGGSFERDAKWLTDSRSVPLVNIPIRVVRGKWDWRDRVKDSWLLHPSRSLLRFVPAGYRGPRFVCMYIVRYIACALELSQLPGELCFVYCHSF